MGTVAATSSPRVTSHAARIVARHMPVTHYPAPQQVHILYATHTRPRLAARTRHISPDADSPIVAGCLEDVVQVALVLGLQGSRVLAQGLALARKPDEPQDLDNKEAAQRQAGDISVMYSPRP